MRINKTPSIVVFDVNETLLDLTTLEPLFSRVFGNASVLREWFAQLILYSQAISLSGIYVSFGELAVGTLHMVAKINGVAITDNDIGELKRRMSMMPAHADVIPALTRLRNAGLRLVTLTNSTSSSSPTPLERAGLDGFFEHSFSVEAVQKFKPSPETYQHVAREMGVETPELCLVACHLWDTIGAQATGCKGALLTRPHNAVLPAIGVPFPDFIGPDLINLVEQMLVSWSTP